MRNTNKHTQDKELEMLRIREEHSFSGPLPRPEDLAKYEQIVPGAAERIIKMAEDEMKHRHNNENRLTKGMIWTTYLSIVFAFFVALALAGLSFYLAYKGHHAASASVAVGSIAAVISAFMLKSKSSGKKQE